LVLGLTLCLCISTQAFGAAHRHPAKPPAPVVIVQEPSQTERWAVMALKIGSIVGALLILGHFELLSSVRWDHAIALEAKGQWMNSALKTKADELTQATLCAAELRKQRDAWKREAENPANRNMYTPAELRQILGQ